MKVSIKINSKTIKITLISVIIIMLSIIMGFFIGRQHRSTEPDETVSPVNSEASISIDKVHQVVTRDGKKEWSLDANSAQYVIPKKIAIFNDLSAIYFLKGGEKVYLKADKGILHTESNDIEITGNVVVKNNNYQLKTEVLHYDHERKKIYSETPVRIFDGISSLVAESMTLDLNTNNLVFDGKVRGIFTGNMPMN